MKKIKSIIYLFTLVGVLFVRPMIAMLPDINRKADGSVPIKPTGPRVHPSSQSGQVFSLPPAMPGRPQVTVSPWIMPPQEVSPEIMATGVDVSPINLGVSTMSLSPSKVTSPVTMGPQGGAVGLLKRRHMSQVALGSASSSDDEEDFIPYKDVLLPVPTVREMLEKLGLSLNNESGYKLHSVSRNIFPVRDLQLPPIDDLVHSNFSWLYNDARIAYVPGINKDLVTYFGREDRFNIGAIFSLGLFGASQLRAWKIKYVSAKQQYQNDLKDIEARLKSMLSMWSKLSPEEKSCKKHLEEKTIFIKETLANLETGNISANDNFIQTKEDLDDYSSKGITHTFLPLSISFPCTEEQIALQLNHIAHFIEQANEVLARGKSIIVTGDILGDKTTALFACWLISQGWNVERAIRQARVKRFEYRQLRPEYRLLIEAYPELVRSR